MKKLLVLMLVLCLASAANAALTLVSIAGTTLDYIINETTRIGIYNDFWPADHLHTNNFLIIEWVDISKGPGPKTIISTIHRHCRAE